MKSRNNIFVCVLFLSILLLIVSAACWNLNNSQEFLDGITEGYAEMDKRSNVS